MGNWINKPLQGRKLVKKRLLSKTAIASSAGTNAGIY